MPKLKKEKTYTWETRKARRTECFQLSVTREATYVVVSAQLPRGRPVNR